MRGSNIVKILIWADLSPYIRHDYQTSIWFYIYWATYIEAIAWPSIIELLEEWATNKIMGSSILKQGQIQLSTFSSYLLAICFLYVDHKYLIVPFEIFQIKLFLQGGKSLLSATKAICLSIIRDILFTITELQLMTINNLNIDITFKIV